MKRLITALAAALIPSTPLCASADWYINPELNAERGVESGLNAGILEGHIGYDFDNQTYLQIGPAAVLSEEGLVEVGLSGKAGFEGEVLYGELTFEATSETTVGFKAGAKFGL